MGFSFRRNNVYRGIKASRSAAWSGDSECDKIWVGRGVSRADSKDERGSEKAPNIEKS